MCYNLTQDEEVRCALISAGHYLSRGELDAGVRRDDFWNTDVAPRFNYPSLHLRFPVLPTPSATVAARGDTGCSDLKCSSFSNFSRTGEYLKANFFRIRALYSECHCRWSLSGQMDPNAFTNYLPVRPGGGPSNYGLTALAFFKALRCGESEEYMAALNFTTKIAPECARIEVSSKESPEYQVQR
jgi:hypothetical protein